MKILFVGCDFPNQFYPTDGLFNGYLVRALAGFNEVKVICPVPWIAQLQGFLRGQKNGPRQRRLPAGAEVYFPTYFYSPKVLQSHYGSFLWWSVRQTVQNVLQTFRPDVVLGYWAHPDGEVAVRIAHQVGVPSAVIIGGSDVLLITEGKRRRRRVVQVLKSAGAVITVNRHLRDKVIEMGIVPSKVHSWHQGVDERFTPGDRFLARRRLGIADTGSVGLWVGRMVPVKGLEVLLRAAAVLKKTAPLFQLYLVGDGPLRKALEEQCIATGLNSVVHFVGTQHHDRLVDWYRAADLTVLPSWSEGLPNVLRESLACGTPFVASRVGGIPEISAGQPENLVEPGDVEGLASAIRGALAAPHVLPSSWRSSNWSESGRALIQIIEQIPRGAFARSCGYGTTALSLSAVGAGGHDNDAATSDFPDVRSPRESVCLSDIRRRSTC